MNDAKYHSLKSRIREEAQLLAEQKWIKEALVKIRAQRNALHIERMQLEAMRAAMIPTLPPDHYARVNEEKKKKAAAKAAAKAASRAAKKTSETVTAEVFKVPETPKTKKVPATTDKVAATTMKATAATDKVAATTSKMAAATISEAAAIIDEAVATTSKAAATTDEAVATTSNAASTTDEAAASTSKASEPFVEPDSPLAEFLKNEATCNSLPLDLGVPPMFGGGHAFRIEQFEEEEEEDEDEDFENDEDLLLDMNMFMNCAQPPQE
ncbi:uncharacterized protein LOC135086792 [Ostrinia nubilalis]|uniref:uncharacterized protein LOC135086792 n=1 Tax=Ostrinia nubilalis TaxID=29057 RepID=UPI0030822902